MKKLLLSALFFSAIGFAQAADELPKMPTITIPTAPVVPKPSVHVKTPIEINTELLVGTINAPTAVTNFIPVKEAISYLDDPKAPADYTKAIGNGNLTVYWILMAEMVANLTGQRDAATKDALRLMGTGFLPTKEDYMRVLQFLPKKQCGSDYILTTQFDGYLYLLRTLKTGNQTAVMAAAIDALETQTQYKDMFTRLNEFCAATH